MQNEDHRHDDQSFGSEDLDLAQFDDDFAQAEVEERKQVLQLGLHGSRQASDQLRGLESGEVVL